MLPRRRHLHQSARLKYADALARLKLGWLVQMQVATHMLACRASPGYNLRRFVQMSLHLCQAKLRHC